QMLKLIEFAGRLIFEEFDQIEALMVHSYADNLAELREERSMNGFKLARFKEQSLHSVQDYVNIIKVLLLLNDKTEHLNEIVVPVVVDWPRQIFI
ncbi:1361_t:CDS:2, partial [Dentiscutata heterogama]